MFHDKTVKLYQNVSWQDSQTVIKCSINLLVKLYQNVRPNVLGQGSQTIAKCSFNLLLKL